MPPTTSCKPFPHLPFYSFILSSFPRSNKHKLQQPAADMEVKKLQGSKRRRASSFQPNAGAYAGFLCRYIGYLLPALAEAAAANAASRRQAKGRSLEKAVRFEVDMALVLSASGHKWSRALKRELLEHGSGGSQLRESFSACRLIAGSSEPLMKRDMFRSPAASAEGAVPRPLALITAARPVSINRRSNNNAGGYGGDDEFSRGMRTLQRILPGGREMCLSELLCEARSYMICLQLQVSILRNLLEVH